MLRFSFKVVLMNSKVLVLLVMGLCQVAFGEVLLSQNLFRKVPFSSQYSEDGSLIRSVDFRSVNDLIPQLEEHFKELLNGRTLQDRNESHVTIITPPEGKTDFFPGSIGIDQVFPTAEMINMYKKSIQDTSFDVVCVGMQKNTKGNIVFFLVLESQDILNIRKDIRDIVLQKDIDRVISSDHPLMANAPYYPHITIGFVGGDIHVDKHGKLISKGSDSCVQGVKFY